MNVTAKEMRRCIETWLVAEVGLIICLGIRNGIAAPTPAPGPDASWWNRHVESISCTKPGYFVNPVDCHSFYRCVDRSTWNKPALQRYDFTCPKGMVFDVAFSVCTKPGANGCADPWWPGSGEAAGKGGSSESRPDSKQGDGNTLERFPSLFGGNRRPGGSSGDPLDVDFGSFETTTKPGSSVGLFTGGGGKDPLDSDFGSPLPGTSSRPGTSGSGGLFGGGSSRDPLDADFGSPSIGGSTRPGGSGGLFGSDRGKDPLDADFGSPPPGSSTRPGGSGGGKDPLDADFGSPPPGSSTRPGESDGFGLFGSGGGKDPLDADFGSPPPGSSSRPGGSGGLFGSGGGKDPLDADFGSPSPGSSTRPGTSGSKSPFSGGNSRDPLDNEFGSPSPGNPTNSGGRGGPFSGGPFGGNSGSSRDPLDADFGSPLEDPGPSGNSNDTPSFLRNRNPNSARPSVGSKSPFGSTSNGGGRDPLDIDFGSSSGSSSSPEDSTSSSNESKGNNRSGSRGSSDESGGVTDSWWGTDNKSPSKWDRNDPNSIEFDNWDAGVSPQTTRKPPSVSLTWGGAPRPSLTEPSTESPWIPTGPWGTDSSNDLGSGPSSPSIPESPSNPSSSIPQSPSQPSSPFPQSPNRPPPPPPPPSPFSPNRQSWWDPPYALPYRPRGPGPRPPLRGPPPPDPWLFSYRPRYPNYEVVAYPTWPPGPPYRNPIIVVYSNSKKK